MQLSHVFIAFLAREVRFPHGFIAFLLFVFLGVPKWPPRAIFCDFGRPLGASWGYLGAILAPYWFQLGILAPSWCPLGPILAHLWPSWCHLGSIFAPTWPSWLHLGALLGLSWHVFGPNFDNLDVRIKNIGTILASHARLSFVPLICISSALPISPLACAPHILSIEPIIYISDCTSYFHL